jgi:hypothetical protein
MWAFVMHLSSEEKQFQKEPTMSVEKYDAYFTTHNATVTELISSKLLH